MFTRVFWVATAERMIRAFSAAFLAFLGADIVDAFHVDYQRAFGVSLGASLASLLFCLAAGKATGGSRPGPAGPAFLAEQLAPASD